MVAHAIKGSRFESRGAKAYGKMLIVAFGLAVLGVMVLHKLREKRILNLILEQKDQQLSSLHLLLQRELDVNKENSKKLEDMKPRLHMLRIQKMELNDDIKVVQSAVEDRNGENRMLRNKITEILKDKDAEIDLLKRGTDEEGAKVWSASNDHPSKALLNATAGDQTLAQINKAGEVDLKSDTKARILEAAQVQIKQKVNNHEVEGLISQPQRKDSTNSDKRDEHQQSTENGNDDEVSRAGMKSQVHRKSQQGTELRGNEKHHSLSRTKEKRWRVIARNRRLERVTEMRGRKVAPGEPSERFVARGKDHLDQPKHEEVQDSQVNIKNDLQEMEKTVDKENSQVGQSSTLKKDDKENSEVGTQEVLPIDGRLKPTFIQLAPNSTESLGLTLQNHIDPGHINQGNPTAQKTEDTNSSNYSETSACKVEVGDKDSGASDESKIEEVRHDLKENTEDSDTTHTEMVNDVLDHQLTLHIENSYSSNDSQTDDAHGDVILRKGKEHGLQEFEAETGGSNTEGNVSGSSDSEIEQHQAI
uniref:Uncharacterized protein n=2 Tax=Kalanchoe fedtschenkoi TaxID=63787 RepID=A0A7N0UT01_KALFE